MPFKPKSTLTRRITLLNSTFFRIPDLPFVSFLRMEEVLCDISAFRLYRTPPAVLELFDPLPSAHDQATRQMLRKIPLVQYVLGSPLHFLVENENARTCAKHIKHHLWTGELPLGSIWQTEGLGKITSPEMTLLLMARHVSPVRLALCMYEFCGLFSVYKIPPELKTRIESKIAGRLSSYGTWQQVRDSRGNPTDLWNRPALLTTDTLHKFASDNAHAYGGQTFARAASMVAGVTRSPLEAEAALLLSLPRRQGGHGLAVETNRTIQLSPKAKKIYRHEYCVADLYIESPDSNQIVDIECQGSSIHSGEAAVTSDANRTTALESMGIHVVQITYADIRSSERLELIAEHIAAKLGTQYRPRTAKMKEAERKVRSEMPESWTQLTG